MPKHKILPSIKQINKAGSRLLLNQKGGENNVKIQIPNTKTWVLLFVILILDLFCHLSYAQQSDELEFTLDMNTSVIPLPAVFRPTIDLSGRGSHHQISWPQVLSGQEALDAWQKDIGFNGIYRIQYNLWEIYELAKDKEAQDNLLLNYETVIKNINDAGGIVLLDIYGTPAGLGRALDKKSPPWDFKAFQELIKGHIRTLSCEKRYNIWYEVWSAPDLDDFFLGRKQDYLNLYRAVAEAVKELENETKVHIPVGGPSVSWWFQNLDGNTVVFPERSLVYELIKFCSQYKLPLDFIIWHAYSNDPKVEKELTSYNKTAVSLIREWLSYFNLDRDMPLIVGEWNYDSGGNVIVERQENANICASYIPARLKNMYKAGINYQMFFSLEDFQDNKEGVLRNVGIIGKSIYNIFRMLAMLDEGFISSITKTDNEFVGIISTKGKDSVALVIYNYIDPEISRNYLSGNIGMLNNAERKILLNLIRSDRLDKLIAKEISLSKVRLSAKLKNILKKAIELNDLAQKYKNAERQVSLTIKNLKENYVYQRYVVDSSCNVNCEFVPVEEKETGVGEAWQERLVLKPYSVNMLVLKKKVEVPPAVSPEISSSGEDLAKTD